MLQQKPSPARRQRIFWWLLAGVAIVAAAWLAADRWLLRPAEWAGSDGIVTEDELPLMKQGETFATGANFTVTKFPGDNCTLSAELEKKAVIGIKRDKERILAFFFSSLELDLSGATALTLRFGEAAPTTQPVARVVTIVDAPVLFLKIPTGLGKQWREAAALTVATADKPVGTFAMGEAQTKAPDILADCVNSL